MIIHHGRKPSRASLAQFFFSVVSILVFNLSWLPSIMAATACNNVAVTTIPQAECEALVNFYNSTGGPNWSDSATNNWNVTDTPCSDWAGVVCGGGYVTEIDRYEKNLTGSIPDLSALTNLQALILAMNQLTGSIPNLSTLTNLQLLNLSSNQLTGSIPDLSTLTNLASLRLYYNQLTGSIPNLSMLTNLQALVLSGNHLTGSIPDWLNTLTNLQILGLNYNRLTGSIPDLSALTNLQTLWLSDNQLTGSIPTSLTNLNILNELDLGYNQLTAQDPTLLTFLSSKDSDWAQTQTIPPTNLQATPLSENSIEITWTPILYTGDGGYYRVKYATTTGGPYTPAATTTADKSATSYVVTDLSPNTTYYFVVEIYTPAHSLQQNELTSELSTEVSATTHQFSTSPPITPPATPLPPITPTTPPATPLPPTMNLTINFGGTGHGSVTTDSTGIDCDSNQAKCSYSVDTATWIRLIPAAAADSKFTGWSGWQSDCNNGEVFMSGLRSCTANFGLLPHQLTVNVLGQGKVNSNPTEIACDSHCSHQFKGGEKVVLTAVPAQDWQFKEWKGDCDQTGQVVMDKDKKCQVTFVSVNAGIDKTAYQDEVTYFKAKVIIPSRQNMLNYQWDFGDSHTANTAIASHTYTTTGTYTVTLTVTDAQDLIGSDTLLVEVKQSTAKVPQEVLKEMEEKGGGRIIIGLNLATQLEGKLSAPAAVSNQRRQIAQVQQQFLNNLQTSLINSPADAKNLAIPTLFTTIPYVAMGVNATQLAHIRENPLVTSIEPDKLSSPILHDSVPLIGGINAHNNGYSGSGQTVAILDTGVDSTHPDLASQVVSEACYSTTYAPYSSTSLCPGSSDEQVGIGAAVPCAISGCTHGTHVAGIAAANGGVIGVANEANIVAIQVFSRFDDPSIFDDPSTCSPPPCVLSYNSDQIQGLERILTLYGSGDSIASVNMSIGGGYYATYCDSDSPSYKAAIDNLRSVGIATVIASGNESYSDGISFPACISSAVSVGATDKLDNIAIYPGWWGSNSAAILDLLAPGSNITSTVPGGITGIMSGTSMATPHVAGAWAVLKAMIPTASVDQILTTLETTGKPITDPRNGLVKPRIQVDQALVELPCNSPTIRSQANGQWTNPSTWNPPRQPNSTDIVLVEHNIEVNTIPAVVQFLCNTGQLTSQNNTSLEISATSGINNVGNISGDRDVILKTATVIGNYDKAGDFWWYTLETTPGPIFNEGTITGGDGDSISTQGGNVILLGRNVTNTGNIQGGKGSDIPVGGGGKGGTAQIFARFGGSQWGNAGNLISSGSVLAGDGGDGGSSGGRGGNLWLVGYPHVYLGMSAVWKDFCFMCSSTGVAGHSAGQGGSPTGEDGWVMIEPSSINLAAGTTIKGGDITIFGGDDWTLKLSEKPVVESSGDITLAVGNNSVVDLTQNTKPILKAANQVNIFADEIRTDAGITLTNLIEAGSGIMTKPSKILHQFTLAGASYLTGQPGETIVMRLTLINNGPTTDTYRLTSSRSGSWRMGQLPSVIEVAGLDTIEFGTEVTLPSTLGAQNTITITATSLTDPTVNATTDITVTVRNDKKSFSQELDNTLSGTVYDPSGAPVAGATLTDGDETLTTDENGHWQIDNNPALTSGTLYDAQGNPLAGATIHLGDQTLTTDAEGRWELTQPIVAEDASLNIPATDSFSVLPPQMSTCYASGLVDWVCNANGQQLTDLTVGPNGMIAYGTLVGTLTNQGWVSNLTLESNSHLTGGIVTGYITNHGEMADFEFRGAAIVGGTLAGEITNTSQVGGYFRDVQLAAKTHLIGGQLAGNIRGDAQAPAFLEHLKIQAGSHLEAVTIGEDVELAAGIFGDSVQFQQPSEDPRLIPQTTSQPAACDTGMPSLRVTAINAAGQIIETQCQCAGGVSVNGGSFEPVVKVRLTDTVEIRGTVCVTPEQIGQLADLVVYLDYQPLDVAAEAKQHYMLDSGGEVLPWDGQVAHLVAFRQTMLTAVQEILLYHGSLATTGQLNLFLGYRLIDGTLISNEQALEITIMDK